MKNDLLALSDFVWQRTSARVAGLSDDEYLWEPVPGCWSVRDYGDGRHFADGVQPAPEPPRFTTIAWRLAHLTDCYGADRNGRFLRVTLAPAVLDATGVRPATASAALDVLARAHSRWRHHLTAVPADEMDEPLGPIAGPYAEGTRATFVLHMLDEFIHHGAEVALLRDLHRARSGLSTGDALIDAAVRDGLPAEAVPSEHPGAVKAAASAGRWDIVVSLAALGFPVDAPGGRSALHLAAGTGPLCAVEALVQRGADTTATEPVWGQTPLGWARYFGNRPAADFLARYER